MGDWHKTNWRAKPRVQMPDYTDAAALAATETQLSKYPPLVFAGEARRLKAQLGEAALAKAQHTLHQTLERGVKFQRAT